VLKIPSSQQQPPPTYTTYIVRQGDTLGGIATMFKTSIQQLMALNPIITNPDRIQVGWELKVPVARTTTTQMTTE
jgi:LysM repeat protein